MRLTEEEQLAVEGQLILGRPTAGILKVAADCKADLIILSSHRIDPAHPTEGWGTISHQISVLADCPVLLVK
jgi:nucleotide-binding universal stress UspA family protein